jgi:hypothetical protein
MTINTNHSNIQFEKELLNVKHWLSNKVSGICGFSSETVHSRLIQYIVAVTLPVYAKKVYALNEHKVGSFPVKGTVLDVGVGTIELGTGCISIDKRQWLRGLSGFLVYWGAFFLAIIIVKKSPSEHDKAVLVYGVGDGIININNSDEQFVNYCKLGPLHTIRIS